MAAATELGLSLLYSGPVHEPLQAYERSVQDLVSLFHGDTNWKVKLFGPLTDGAYPIKYYQVPGKGYWCASVSQRPHQKAYHVHNRLQVGLEGKGDAVPDDNSPPLLMLHVDASSKDPTRVRLWMSSRTRSLLPQADYGLELEKAVSVEDDENSLPRFFLSAKIVDSHFQRRNPSFILLDPPYVMRLPRSLNHLVNDDDEMPEGAAACPLAEYTYGLERNVAITCLERPACARQWPARVKRAWPSADLIRRVLAKKTYLIPTKRSPPCDGFDWCYSFIEAETELMNSLSPKQHMCYVEVKKVLLFRLQHGYLLSESHFKHAFFWVLEQEKRFVWDSEGLGNCLLHVLRGLKPMFDVAKLPHYFIPEVNLFDSITFPCNRIHSMGDVIRDLLLDGVNDYLDRAGTMFSVWDLAAEEVSPDQQQDIRRCLTRCLEATLQAVFDEQVRLAYLQLFAQMCHYVSVDICIGKTTDRIKLLTKLSVSSRIVTPMRELLTNLLGNLYLVKAMSLKLSQERSFFAQKAEECLLQSHNMDLMVGKVKLANFFHMTSRWPDSVQLLQEVLQHSGQDRDNYALDLNVPDQQQRTYDKIWLKWINRNYLFPFAVAGAHEACTVPSIVQKSLDLASCPVLGTVSVVPVSVLDTDIYARLLLVLGLIKLGHRDTALTQLNIVEHTCEKEDHMDHNEKRNVTYLNVVAHCYELLGERALCVHNLCRSIAILPNPINPGRWMLVGIQTERVRRYIAGGLGAAAALGLAAVVISAVKNRLT